MRRLSVKVDKLARLTRGINGLITSDVLVGVPAKTAPREDEEGTQEINNATLAFIHDNGSPANNIPARPFMRPGIKRARDKIARQFKRAANAALNGDKGLVEAGFSGAGLVAQNSIKNEIDIGDFVPLKPETVRRRMHQRMTKSMRQSERDYLLRVSRRAQEKGADLDVEDYKQIQSETGIKPLINTGSMRNSINYVIRRKARR